jgi:hypothetical protein
VQKPSSAGWPCSIQIGLCCGRWTCDWAI